MIPGRPDDILHLECEVKADIKVPSVEIWFLTRGTSAQAHGGGWSNLWRFIIGAGPVGLVRTQIFSFFKRKNHLRLLPGETFDRCLVQPFRMARCGHAGPAGRRPLLRVEQTCDGSAELPVLDPTRTSSRQANDARTALHGGVRWRVTISRRVSVTVQPIPNLQETVPIFYAIN
jgi:hypothetical protein